MYGKHDKSLHNPCGLYPIYQLRLPLDLSLVIDKLDPMWSFLEIVNSINLSRFIRSHKGNQGYNPIMMMRVILFVYMNRVYSLRTIEEKYKTDIRFMYLCQDERQSFMAFQRFISNQSKLFRLIYRDRVGHL